MNASKLCLCLPLPLNNGSTANQFCFLLSSSPIKTQFILTYLHSRQRLLTSHYGRPQGRGQGGLLPPLAGQSWPQILCFQTFFGKNSIFFVVFKVKCRFLPRWKKICGRPCQSQIVNGINERSMSSLQFSFASWCYCCRCLCRGHKKHRLH